MVFILLCYFTLIVLNFKFSGHSIVPIPLFSSDLIACLTFAFLLLKTYIGLTENGWIGEETQSRRMRFSFKLGSLAFLLIHEDIMVCNSTTGQLSKSTILQMRKLAESFFSQLGLFSFAGAGAKDLSVTKEKLNSACSKSHLQ